MSNPIVVDVPEALLDQFEDHHHKGYAVQAVTITPENIALCASMFGTAVIARPVRKGGGTEPAFRISTKHEIYAFVGWSVTLMPGNAPRAYSPRKFKEAFIRLADCAVNPSEPGTVAITDAAAEVLASVFELTQPSLTFWNGNFWLIAKDPNTENAVLMEVVWTATEPLESSSEEIAYDGSTGMLQVD